MWTQPSFVWQRKFVVILLDIVDARHRSSSPFSADATFISDGHVSPCWFPSREASDIPAC